MSAADLSDALLGKVGHFVETRTAFDIAGNGSKSFFGVPSSDRPVLNVAGHRGIVSYEPSECVVTARTGTPLIELNRLLAENGQMLAFEPPVFNVNATLGGTVACGFSGPRRPYAASVRDSVLGCTLINGKAERLRFGGQVMKNVAGFDVSRLMAGAMGQLGVLLDISLRVVPLPEAEITITRSVSSYTQALSLMTQWQRQPWPISALAYDGQRLMARLSGADNAIKAVSRRLEGDIEPQGAEFWQELRDHRLDFFASPDPLWRISIAPASPMSSIGGEWLLDWGGAQRWLKSSASAESIHASAQTQNAHAVCFKSLDKTDWLRLEPGLLALQQRVRLSFDPYRLLNPQRYLPES